MLNRAPKFLFGSHSQFAIIGGGTAGLNLSSQLKQAGVLNNHIRIFEPSKTHAYQPAWTLVAGGEYNHQNSIRPTKKVFGNTPLSELAVTKVDPENNTIYTEDGDSYTYDQLIVATGLKLDYNKIKGAVEALEDPACPVGSAYTRQYAVKFSELVKNFRGGDFVFHEPPMPIKCAGAPQKVCFLTEHNLRKQGIKSNTNLSFYMAKGVVFGVPKYSALLANLHKEKEVNVNLGMNITEINKDTQTITYVNTANGAKQQKKFDALHLVPPQSAPEFIKDSGLGDSTGFVEVNKGTMQHIKYKNVWSLGDSSNLPTSKTAAAVFAQTPVLVHNLLVTTQKKSEPFHIYEGYSSCPITVGDNKLMLAEFKYEGVVDETFPVDQGQPRTLFYQMKKYFFPFAYWSFVPRGMWHGRKAFLPHIPFLEYFMTGPTKEGHH